MNSALKQEKNTSSSTAHVKVGFKEKIGFAMGDVGISILWATVGAFITYFYTDKIGISALVVGNIMFIVRLLDAFSDLGMGIVVDKTNTKDGKGRTWLLRLCIPYALLGLAVFTFPNLGPTGTIWYAGITFLLFNIAYSGVSIPLNVMNSTISQDPFERSMLTVFRTFFGLTTVMVISIFIMPLANSMGGDKFAWIKLIGILSIVSPILIFVSYKSTKERVVPSVVTKEIPLKQGIIALFRNKYWFIMLLVNVCNAAFLALLLGLSAYYAQNVLHNMGLVGLLATGAMLPTIIGMFFMSPLIKHFGNRNTAIIGTIVQIVGGAIMMINPTSIPILMIGMCIRSLGTAASIAPAVSMLAETVEYGEWKTGIRTDGLIFSAASVGGKIGSSLGAGLIGWILGFAGYVAGGGAQHSGVITSIKMMYIHIPMGISLIMLVFLIMFNLEKKRPMIFAELEALREQKQ
ncbi:MFS transporter [Peribacillus sp. NPDC096379]|uniref:MFS transporter n=1 Tax=Peribacillus sp. NPDC096379 TaxID=3364393 RepID=UPI0038124A19